MPYRVTQAARCPAGKPWACVNAQTGRIVGCHATQTEAQKQMSALYANEPGARRPTDRT